MVLAGSGVFLLGQAANAAAERRSGRLRFSKGASSDGPNRDARAVRFLNIGVDYFKRGDRKALMKLSREERALFNKELSIGTGAGE